ncbi:MAG: dihydropteroate synthase [Clostridia bacterium]|nr:dihydropteroate synthase [Clostridia bacterium]
MEWLCRGKRLPLTGTLVMGIVNVTPDSFYDGGRYASPEAAVRHAKRLLAQGADLLDLGACSTRPGSSPVGPEEEAARLLPVLRRLRRLTDRPLSVDTTCAAVARQALAEGADILNDVSGDPASPLLTLAAQSGAGYVAVHTGGGADDRALDDALPTVRRFFEAAAAAAQAAGMDPRCLCLDPGIGFGKSDAGDRQLIARLAELTAGLPYPVLAGASRKRVASEGGALPPAERLPGTLALHTLAQWNGARILRVHDVAAAVRAARLTDRLIFCRKSC